MMRRCFLRYFVFQIILFHCFAIINTSDLDIKDKKKLHFIVKDIENDVFSTLKDNYNDDVLKFICETNQSNRITLLHYHSIQNKNILCKDCKAKITLSNRIATPLSKLLITFCDHNSDAKQAIKKYIATIGSDFSTLEIYRDQVQSIPEGTDGEGIKFDSYANVKQALSHELLNVTKIALISSIKNGRPAVYKSSIVKINDCFLWIKNNLHTIECQLFESVSHDDVKPVFDKTHTRPINRGMFVLCIGLLFVSIYFNIQYYLTSRKQVPS